MGQTLTHGIYLPDEGERNCYDGLAGNWQLLDNSVGTIAEHSTQISVKAPLVHTHTKSDITDFPVYGTTAGTICEGNDSRLSDARTPVAHTHTKSDVTDLLNSNFIPSANNSYDLGSSSYQWNNLYAKNYYYNGTAWGLDKDNTWTGANSFYKSVQIHGSRNAYIMPEFGASYSGLAFGTVELKQSFKFGDWVDNNSTIGLNTSNAYVEIYAGLDSSDNVNKARLCPVNATVAELGTSTNKWKTLNGINPGGLSLPGTGGYTDIKGDITNLSGGYNTFTAPYDGWVCVKSANATVIHIINTNWAVCQSATQNTAGTLCCLCPVMSGQSFSVIVNATSLEYAYIHPCQGNI